MITLVNENQTLFLKSIPSPIGIITIGATDTNLYLLEFSDRQKIQDEINTLISKIHTEIIESDNDLIIKTELQLMEYFDGKRFEFDLPVQYIGTDFQISVWKELVRVDYGETISYKQLAGRINNPNAMRAVGKANGENRISIVIPCHRVIGENGKLVGYGGGIWRKRWLIQHEKRHLPLKF